MPYQSFDDEEPATFEFERPASVRKRRAVMCGPLGRAVGLFTLVCALGGMLSRTSMAASSLLVAQSTTHLPVTSEELLTCLKRNCDSSVTELGLHWAVPENARLLKCLTHSQGGLQAGGCWAPDDTKVGRAVKECAVHHFCATARGGSSIGFGQPQFQPGSVRGGQAPSPPDWSTGWERYVPGSGSSQAGTSSGNSFMPGTMAAASKSHSSKHHTKHHTKHHEKAGVRARPTRGAKDNQELLECIHHHCPKESDAVGAHWTNPVNTDLTACLATSQNGHDATVSCFPPVIPSMRAEYKESYTLRYCALCSSCIAGDRGSAVCNKKGFKGPHAVKKLLSRQPKTSLFPPKPSSLFVNDFTEDQEPVSNSLLNVDDLTSLSESNQETNVLDAEDESDSLSEPSLLEAEEESFSEPHLLEEPNSSA